MWACIPNYLFCLCSKNGSLKETLGNWQTSQLLHDCVQPWMNTNNEIYEICHMKYEHKINLIRKQQQAMLQTSLAQHRKAHSHCCFCWCFYCVNVIVSVYPWHNDRNHNNSHETAHDELGRCRVNCTLQKGWLCANNGTPPKRQSRTVRRQSTGDQKAVNRQSKAMPIMPCQPVSTSVNLLAACLYFFDCRKARPAAAFSFPATTGSFCTGHTRVQNSR